MTRSLVAILLFPILVACSESSRDVSPAGSTGSQTDAPPKEMKREQPPPAVSFSGEVASEMDEPDTESLVCEDAQDPMEQVHGPAAPFTEAELAKVYAGTLTIGFERCAFRPEGQEDEAYWVVGRLEEIRLPQFDQNRDVSVRVKVRGVLSEPGAHGHLGAYERRLTVLEVLEHEIIGKK